MGGARKVGQVALGDWGVIVRLHVALPYLVACPFALFALTKRIRSRRKGWTGEAGCGSKRNGAGVREVPWMHPW